MNFWLILDRSGISEELSFSTGGDHFQSGPAIGGKVVSQPALGEYLGERNAVESPSASVASSSVFSRSSGKYDM